MGQVPPPQPTAQTKTEICRTPVLIPEMQALVTCAKERYLVDWLAMGGQSVIGWTASRPDSLTDRPTDRIRNNPAGKLVSFPFLSFFFLNSLKAGPGQTKQVPDWLRRFSAESLCFYMLSFYRRVYARLETDGY